MAVDCKPTKNKIAPDRQQKSRLVRFVEKRLQYKVNKELVTKQTELLRSKCKPMKGHGDTPPPPPFVALLTLDVINLCFFGHELHIFYERLPKIRALIGQSVTNL